MTPKNGSRQVGSRGRPVVNRSPWAYWPVYVGLSLAGLLVTAGLVLAVQNLKRPQAAMDIPEIPPPYSSARDKASDVRENRTLPIQAQAKQEVGIPIATAKAKPILAVPLIAAKQAPELVPPLPEKNTIVKTVPMLEKSV